MVFWIGVLLSFALASVCGHYARRKGRNENYWFVAGALFGLFALLALWIFPRRTPAAAPIKARFEARTASQQERLWYILTGDNAQEGPMSFVALQKAWETQKIKKETWTWNEEMEGWKPLHEAVHL